jgi:hypothetical protein
MNSDRLQPGSCTPLQVRGDQKGLRKLAVAAQFEPPEILVPGGAFWHLWARCHLETESLELIRLNFGSRLRSTRWSRTAAGSRDQVSICGIYSPKMKRPHSSPSSFASFGSAAARKRSGKSEKRLLFFLLLPFPSALPGLARPVRRAHDCRCAAFSSRCVRPVRPDAWARSRFGGRVSWWSLRPIHRHGADWGSAVRICREPVGLKGWSAHLVPKRTLCPPYLAMYPM